MRRFEGKGVIVTGAGAGIGSRGNDASRDHGRGTG